MSNTRTEATTFAKKSEKNAKIIIEAINKRKENGEYEDCECKPYEDTFTFQRWKKQNFGVKKGEKALAKISYMFDDEYENKKKFSSACIFCRCQVIDNTVPKTEDKKVTA